MLRIIFLATLIAILMPREALSQDWLNTRINDDNTGELQNEQQIVVNPTNPLNLVSVWRDFRLGYRQVGYGYTLDGGRTWTNPGLFVDPHYPRDSDPALTVNAAGTFFAMLLAYTGSTSQSNGMLMYRSTDGGQTWEDRGFAVNGVPGVFEDKEFIACDRTGSQFHNRVYMVWDRFNATDILCVSTADEGDTWTSERLVSDADGNQFPTPAVGPDGTFYCAWTHFWDSSLRFDSSFDGGLTFGNDVVVTGLYNPHPTLNGSIESPAHPAMDVDISGGVHDGRIYIAYLNLVNSSDYDIYIRHSDDRGGSWSDARRVNDDDFNNGCDQFHPWLTVDNTGIVTVVWLDRRHDPQNRSWHCFISQSMDGGMTWTPNQQVSTEPSSPDYVDLGEDQRETYAADREGKLARGPRTPGWVRRAQAASSDGEHFWPRPDQEESRAGRIGEYIGIACADGFATAVWTDTRNLNQDTYGGVAETFSANEEHPAESPGALLRLAPNPIHGPVALSYTIPTDGWVTLEVLAANGRRVRTLVDRKLRAGERQFVWDGRDQGGRRVAAGNYIARYTAPGCAESHTLCMP